MIKDAKNGWCSFNLGGFSGHPSYLTNVPLDLLEAFNNYFEFATPFSVYFDEEGTDFSLVSTPYNLFIIEEKEKPVLWVIEDANIYDVALELYYDIKNDFDNWCNFDCSVIESEDYEYNYNNLKNELNKFEKLLIEKNILKEYNKEER